MLLIGSHWIKTFLFFLFFACSLLSWLKPRIFACKWQKYVYSVLMIRHKKVLTVERQTSSMLPNEQQPQNHIPCWSGDLCQFTFNECKNFGWGTLWAANLFESMSSLLLSVNHKFQLRFQWVAHFNWSTEGTSVWVCLRSGFAGISR